MSKGDSAIKLSVIVPVFNDNEGLAKCLYALENQTLCPDQYEVLVVDNGSTVSLTEALRGFPKVKLVVEAEPGSYAARNTGIASAKGALLAFTDADCVPHVEWLQRAIEVMESDPDCAVIIGRVVMTVKDPGRPTSAEIYQMMVGFQQQKLLNARNYGVTANLITRRSIIDEIGIFDPRMKSAGDMQWGRRVHDKGLKQKYIKGVVVYHPARTSMVRLCAQTRRVAGGRFQLRELNGIRGKGAATKPISSIVQSVKTVLFTELDNIALTKLMRCRALFVGLIVRSCYVLESFRLRLGGQPGR